MRKRRKETKVDSLPKASLFIPSESTANFRLIRWNLKEGDQVSIGDMICSASKIAPPVTTTSSTSVTNADINNEEDEFEVPLPMCVELKSTHDGTISRQFVIENQVFTSDQAVVEIQFCMHDVVLDSGLCTLCGRLVHREASTEETPAPIVVNVGGIL